MLDVLLIEDDEDVRECIASWIEEAGHRVTQASDGGRAATLLESRSFDVAICDVHLPTIDGLTLARRARNVSPSTAVVMMSSAGTVSDVVASLRDGAIDYVVKPFDADRLVTQVLAPIAERRALKKQLESARQEWVDTAVGVRIVAASPEMKALVDRMGSVAQSDAHVLLCGERGTGKKTLARLIHEQSARRQGPFVVVPCGSLAELIVESELRALADLSERDAWFTRADGGTLVLDGVDRVPPSVQSTLARLLAEPEPRARRGADWQPRGVRVVATAQADLAGKVVTGDFLEPLFYPLSAAVVGVPPLRERPADMLPLIAAVLASLAPSWAIPPALEPSAYAALSAYAFPGNVSELVWALKYAFLMADTSPIELAHLPHRVRLEAAAAGFPM